MKDLVYQAAIVGLSSSSAVVLYGIAIKGSITSAPNLSAVSTAGALLGAHYALRGPLLLTWG